MNQVRRANDKVEQGMGGLHREVQRTFDLQPLVIPFLAILLAVLVGGVLILITGGNPIEAYVALLQGMFGTPGRVAASISRKSCMRLSCADVVG